MIQDVKGKGINMAKKKYYVVDIDCTGHADVVTTLPEDYWFLITECNDMETANNEAEKYEIRVQEEIDKSTGNYDYDDYDYDDYDE